MQSPPGEAVRKRGPPRAKRIQRSPSPEASVSSSSEEDAPKKKKSPKKPSEPLSSTPPKEKKAKTPPAPQPQVGKRKRGRPPRPKLPLPIELVSELAVFFPQCIRFRVFARVCKAWRAAALATISIIPYPLRLTPGANLTHLKALRELHVLSTTHSVDKRMSFPSSLQIFSHEYDSITPPPRCAHGAYASLKNLTSLSVQLDCQCTTWTDLLLSSSASLQSLTIRVTTMDYAIEDTLKSFFRSYYAPSLKRVAVEIGTEAFPVTQPIIILLSAHRSQLTSLSINSRTAPSFLEQIFAHPYPCITECSLKAGFSSEAFLRQIQQAMPRLRYLDLLSWEGKQVPIVSHVLRSLLDKIDEKKQRYTCEVYSFQAILLPLFSELDA